MCPCNIPAFQYCYLYELYELVEGGQIIDLERSFVGLHFGRKSARSTSRQVFGMSLCRIRLACLPSRPHFTMCSSCLKLWFHAASVVPTQVITTSQITCTSRSPSSGNSKRLVCLVPLPDRLQLSSVPKSFCRTKKKKKKKRTTYTMLNKMLIRTTSHL